MPQFLDNLNTLHSCIYERVTIQILTISEKIKCFKITGLGVYFILKNFPLISNNNNKNIKVLTMSLDNLTCVYINIDATLWKILQHYKIKNNVT